MRECIMSEMLNMNALTKAAQAGQPIAQYQLGALYFSKGDINSALEWLGHAAESNVPDAQNLLGIIHLNGIGTLCQPQKAVEYFSSAATLDLKEAHFNLSGLMFCGNVIQNDDKAAYRHLLRAAELNHRPALRVLGYLYSITKDAVIQDLSLRCLAKAASLGDTHAAYALGMHYLTGAAAVNLDEAIYWIARAANKNLYCAGVRLKSIVKDKGEAYVKHVKDHHISVAKEHSFNPSHLIDPNIQIETQLLSMPESKTVSQHPQFLAASLCDYLINLAAPQLLPSGVVDPKTGKSLQTTLRTSSSMNYQLSMYDMVVGLICRRLSALAGMRVLQAEPLSILRYLPGQEYKPHYDHFAMDARGSPNVQDANGQRIVTVFVYLNEVDEGGATDFPRLNVQVQPGKGKAVVFQNCDTDGTPDKDTLHAGLPVISGEKWLATLWFRERAFNWV